MSRTLIAPEIFQEAPSTAAACWSMMARPAWRARLAAVVAAFLMVTGLHVLSSARAKAENAQGTWASTAGPASARTGHTATLLDNGDVLITGGRSDDGSALSSSELYDVDAGTWSLTVGAMSTPRFRHTATLLPDGKVLVVGGLGAQREVLSSVEIFDPATGRWTTTASLAAARVAHTATLLGTNRILVAGGISSADLLEGCEPNDLEPDVDPDCVALQSSELYTLSTGTWSPGPSMLHPHGEHTATLLKDGKVLVAGGMLQGQINSRDDGILPGQTRNETSVREFAEVFDPASGGQGEWTEAGALVHNRERHTATLLADGSVLLAGGHNCLTSPDRRHSGYQCGSTGSAEIYDPTSRSWRATGSFVTDRREEHSATRLANGRVLVAGGGFEQDIGTNFRENVTSAEIYDPAGEGVDESSGASVRGGWRRTGSLVTPRSTHSATLLLSGRVLVAGGNFAFRFSYGPESGARAEMFDPASSEQPPSVTGVEPPSGPVGGHTEVVISGAGFLGTEAVRFGEADAPYFRVESHRRIVATTPAHSPGAVDVTLVSEAGTSAAIGRVSRFTYQTGSGAWLPASPFAEGLFRHTATLLGGPACKSESPPAHCGKVLVAGGTTGAAAVKAAQLYDPSTTSVTDGVTFPGRWEPTGSMVRGRIGHTASSLEDGRVLIVGGGTQEAELYEPGASDAASGVPGAWAPAGSLGRSPSGHTATVLRDGKVLVAGGGSAAAHVYDPVGTDPATGAKGMWTSGGSMTTSRSNHTATLLGDGKVLVSGGGSSTTEIYDPAAVNPASRWVAVASMSSSRSGHTATRLDDGRVLVVGGGSATAELYDPGAADPTTGATGTWSPVASMSTSRSRHTATLLRDGRVLVVGGAAAFAEAYQPATGSWDATALMAKPRNADHSATLLGDGTTLLTGGDGPLASNELFDPDANRVEPAIAAISAQAGPTFGGTRVTITGLRFFHPATTVFFGDKAAAQTSVTSDREIVAISPTHSRGAVDLTVGTPLGTSLPARFVYGEGAWSPAGPLSGCTPTSPLCAARSRHTATVLADGRVLVAGGRIENATNGESLASSELYDPGTGEWSPTGSLNVGRQDHAATLLPNGKVLVSGGSGKDLQSGTTSAEIYDPMATDPTTGLKGRWTETGSMTTPRAGHTETLLNDEGDVLVVGGGGSTRRLSAPNDLVSIPVASTLAEVYDSATGTWSLTEPMKERQPRFLHTATPIGGGKVLVAGGRGGVGGSALGSAEVYDHVSNKWTSTTSPLPSTRFGHVAVPVPGGKVLISGGAVATTEGRGHSSVELYDPANNDFTDAPRMKQARLNHVAVVLPGGKILVVGGGGDGRSAELYDPVTKEWTWTSSTELANRNRPTLSVVDKGLCGQRCGGVLLLGGENSAVNFDDAEFYTVAPEVRTIEPASGPSAGGTSVVLTGIGMSAVTKVTFGDTEARTFSVTSPTELKAVSPTHRAGPVEVVLTSPGGLSLSSTSVRFSYLVKGAPSDLAAEVLSDVAIRLRFSTSGTDGPVPQPLTRYIARLSRSPILDEPSFSAGIDVCEGGVCEFPTASIPGKIELTVANLEPGTTYHFAVRAIGPEEQVGPLSNPASATTTGTPPTVPAPTCQGLPAVSVGEVRYPSGYSMVGLPEATRVGAQSQLYGWLDAGARGAYTVHDPDAPVLGGRGYWAWFSCPSVIAPAGPGTTEATLPLGRYRASMVGNPSGTDAVRVTGHDFAARWDPRLNNGAGGYRISKLREDQVLAVGQATWVFSYRETTIKMAPG